MHTPILPSGVQASVSIAISLSSRPPPCCRGRIVLKRYRNTAFADHAHSGSSAASVPVGRRRLCLPVRDRQPRRFTPCPENRVKYFYVPADLVEFLSSLRSLRLAAKVINPQIHQSVDPFLSGSSIASNDFAPLNGNQKRRPETATRSGNQKRQKEEIDAESVNFEWIKKPSWDQSLNPPRTRRKSQPVRRGSFDPRHGIFALEKREEEVFTLNALRTSLTFPLK